VENEVGEVVVAIESE